MMASALLPQTATECVGWTLRTTPGARRNTSVMSPIRPKDARLRVCLEDPAAGAHDEAARQNGRDPSTLPPCVRPYLPPDGLPASSHEPIQRAEGTQGHESDKVETWHAGFEPMIE